MLSVPKLSERRASCPPTMLTVQVGHSDTLTSLAAYHRCRPSEISAANRLSLPMLFAGQQLRVPSRREQYRHASVPNECEAKHSTEEATHAAQRRHSTIGWWPDNKTFPEEEDTSSSIPEKDDQYQPTRHVRISARFITPGRGAPFGTLLLTPNRLIFEPHVSDPLVMALGSDNYFITLPLTNIVKVSRVHHQALVDAYRYPKSSRAIEKQETSQAHELDILKLSKMRTCSQEFQCPGRGIISVLDVPEILRPPLPENDTEITTPTTVDDSTSALTNIGDGKTGTESTISAAKTIPLAVQQDKDEKTSVAETKSGSVEMKTPTGPDIPNSHVDVKTTCSRDKATEETTGKKRAHRLSPTIPILASSLLNNYRSLNPTTEKDFHRRRLSEPACRYTPSPTSFAKRLKALPDTPSSDYSSADEEEDKEVELRKYHRVRYKSLVTMDDTPLMFSCFDEPIPGAEPVTEDEFEPDVHVRLVIRPRLDLPLPKSGSLRVCGKQILPSQLWFTIQSKECSRMCAFLQKWASEIQHTDEPASSDLANEDGELDSDTDFWHWDEDWCAQQTRSSHENIEKQSEDRIEARPRTPQLDLATEAAMARLPELVGRTELLGEPQLAELYRRQPPRVEGHPWTLVFSTTDDGYSLKTLYTKARIFQGPMLLVIRDTENQTFGALTSDPLRLDGHYYGTGESFLYRSGPPFQSYHWTGENPFFARGTPEGLEFGSGQGHAGLFVDADLYRGHTQRCSTFDNEPLTEPAEFKVVSLELWALGWDSAS